MSFRSDLRRTVSPVEPIGPTEALPDADVPCPRFRSGLCTGIRRTESGAAQRRLSRLASSAPGEILPSDVDHFFDWDGACAMTL
jgi:hypothetical protein